MVSVIRRISGFWFPLAAVTAIFVSSAVTDAKEPPSEMRDWCFENKEYDCSGPICSCCTEDGCWICDRHEEPNDQTCHWDDKYGARVQRQELLPGGQPLTVNPGPDSPGIRRPPTFRPSGVIQRLQKQ